ncbi:SPOR domain-containing protein [Bacteroidota bacterium]
MFKILRIFIVLILVNNTLHAQDWNEIFYLESEAEYLVEEREYEKAIDIYRRMLREVPDHSMAKFKIGELYLRTDDQKARAIEFLEEAAKDVALDLNEKSLRETRAPVDALLYLGKAYQIENRIDNAAVEYNKLKGLIQSDHALYPIVMQQLKTCENAKVAMNKPLRVVKNNLGEPLNNTDSNFGAVISGDGNTIIYTSYTRNYLDNYYSVKKDGVWSTPKRISEKLSGKYYLKTVSLSYDGTKLFLVTDDPDNNNIFVCYKEGSSWAEAEKLPKTINGKKSNETHACISKDGNSLYFTSNREGGQGGVDIYKSTKDAKGGWGEAENLGSAVNTKFDEATPFATLDDKYLVFSSQGHSSIGGFDIFYIDLASKSMAINMGYPVNTTGDDLFFVPDNSLSAGYTSLFDLNSIGKNDIYYVSIIPKINLSGIIKNQENTEKIIDLSFDISILESSTNNVIETISSNNGEFNLEIEPGNYTVTINNESYDPFTSAVNVPDNYSENTYSFEALLNPIKVEEELVAEVVEEVVEEPEPAPVVEEQEVIEPLKEEVIEEKVEEPEEEIIEEKPEPVKEVIPEPVKVEKAPEKEVVKYVPKTSTVSAGTIKTYSVQLMALKNPVEVDYFKDVDNVILTQYPDGYYRYTVGNTESYTEAKEIKSKIHEIGYKDAFIRVNEISFKYTIQVMALIIPIKPDYFKDLTSVIVTKGSGDYFRYTIGSYNSYEEAKQELNNIKSLGYNQAFIKKVN